MNNQQKKKGREEEERKKERISHSYISASTFLGSISEVVQKYKNFGIYVILACVAMHFGCIKKGG